MLSRAYVGTPGRQTHYADNGGPRTGTPLVCLHATAYSGRSFDQFLEAIGPDRRAVALDTAGYGGSDKPAAPPNLEDYAWRVGEAIDALGQSRVDMLGYHTGALIATELARQRPTLVRRLVLIGVPCFSGHEQAAWKARLAERTRLGETLEQFGPRWRYLVTDRAAGVDLAQGFAHFVDELRSYPESWWAHDAAFTSDVPALLRQVEQPTLVLNPMTPLSEGSRRAARHLRRGCLVELPHLGHGVLDLAAAEIAHRTNLFLRED